MDEFNTNNLDVQNLKDINFKHGGNILIKAKQLNLLPSKVIDEVISKGPPEVQDEAQALKQQLS